MQPVSKDKPHIAYFSMEVGLQSDMPTYSGGLGVLAGDTLKSFADLGLPVVAITLLNEKGYFKQHIDEHGNQIESPADWKFSEFLNLESSAVTVHLEGREVKLRAWKYLITGINGHTNPVYFLDSNVEGNSEYDRELTSFLYGKDRYYRLCQEIILGIGGMRMLSTLGYHNISKYHMNEGHAGLLTVELHKKMCFTCEPQQHLESVKQKCVFTTHTPVEAGHDKFDINLFRQLLGDYVPENILSLIQQDNQVNMTLLGLNLSNYVNGVAKRHGEVTRAMFPHHRISSITNGVHAMSWSCQHIKDVFNKHIPSWSTDPYSLRNSLSIPKEELWDAHSKAKKELIDFINEKTHAGYHEGRFTIGYARRFTGYKRPDLLVADLQRLKEIAQEVGDIQVVYAGKAHKQDGHGKELIKKIVELSKELHSSNSKLKIVFLEGYNMEIAKMLVSGCDVWLNNPQRPYEASGTSGMKAAVNGVPQISTLDGWWIEGHIEGVTGWSLGPHPQHEGFEDDYSMDDEAEDLYRKLKEEVVPLFYSNRDAWVRIMAHCIAINASFFNTYRMVQQYIATAYVN